MREIANLAREDNKVLTTLAEGSRKDSKVMKSVSVLATLYLPASLIAVSIKSLVIRHLLKSRSPSLAQLLFKRNR
jgi:hypothetical protein